MKRAGLLVLTTAETKIVLSTLTQRRAWLRKAIEDSKVNEDTRKEYSATIGALDSAMKKLAAAAPPPSAAKTEIPSPAPRNKSLTQENAKILIADDQAVIIEMLSQTFADFGVTQIETASDGREAFDKIKMASPPFDIIICDWEMPELDGLQVLEKAKASNTLGDALFWMVTANTDTQKIKQAVAKGINDYIAKPVEPNILLEKFKAALQAKGGTFKDKKDREEQKAKTSPE